MDTLQNTGQTSTPPSPNDHRASVNLLPLPYLSLRERDRRWRLTHALLERNGLDCALAIGASPFDHGAAI